MQLKNLTTFQHQKIKTLDVDTRDYFIRIDHDCFKKQGCISDDEKIRLNNLYKEKCELNQVIRENTDDEKSKMIPIVICKYFGYSLLQLNN